MELPKSDELIPQQETGNKSDTETLQECTSDSEAKQLYEAAKLRLLQVNTWHETAGKLTADFKLCDAQGNEVQRSVQVGDHFKIDIPGPGTVTGEGFDWVRVEAIDEIQECDMESLVIRVRPATNPHNNRNDVAHFFTEEATSNFMIKRKGKTVSAEVHGRNEKPNTEAEKVVDKARNAAVATGAVSGFAKLQWKNLVNGLLKI
jgi:hypothetical protein